MTNALPLADTSDMYAIHRVFRNALGRGPDLVVHAADDPARTELVGSYLDNVLRMLHAHHEGEDELLTPRLETRCAPGEVEDVRRIADQHDAVLGSLSATEQLLATWRAQPTPDTTEALRGALGELHDVLCPHLDEEEQVVLPIAARHIDVAEWGELPGHAMRTFTGDKLWLVLGLVREQMSPAQLADMEAHMPPPLLAMWQTQGEAQFGEFQQRLGS